MTLRKVPNLNNIKAVALAPSVSVEFGPDHTQQAAHDVGTSNGSASQITNSVNLTTNGNDGNWAYAVINGRPVHASSGIFLAEGNFFTNQTPANLDERIWCHGTITEQPFDNGATFRPDVGANTSGNVKVAKGGTVTNGTADLSDFGTGGAYIYLAIVVDFQNGKTEFFVDRDPWSETPNESLNVVPNSLEHLYVGGYIESNGNDSNEQLRVMRSAWTWLPSGF